MTDRRLNDATPEEWDDAFNALQKQIDLRNGKVPDYTGYDPQPKVDEYAKYVKEFNKASKIQIGGNHYKQFKIQPAEFCYKNNIPYLEATAIKYLCRWKDKGGIQDLEKARHYIDLLIEFQDANN